MELIQGRGMMDRIFEHGGCHGETPNSCHCCCEVIGGESRGCAGGPGVLECVAAALLAVHDAAEYLQVLYC